MAKLGSSDILPLIHTYLLEIGLEKIAKKLAKASGLDLQSEVQHFFFISEKNLNFPKEIWNCLQKAS